MKVHFFTPFIRNFGETLNKNVSYVIPLYGQITNNKKQKVNLLENIFIYESCDRMESTL